MSTNTTASARAESTRYLTRPEGRVAYEIDGSGSLVVLVPGMGDLRSTYRFLAPSLQEAGYRVASIDFQLARMHSTFDGEESAVCVIWILVEEAGE